MTEVDVCWVTADPEGEDARGFWDQTLVEHLFDRLAANYDITWRHHHRGVPAGVQGCVLVVKAGFDDPEHIQKIIRRLKWVVLFSTSDEEQRWPWWEVTHRKMTRWVSWAKEPHLHSADRLIPCGPTPHGMRGPGEAGQWMDEKATWGFLGQLTHERRRAAMAAMAQVPRGIMRTTEGFAQGVPHDAYARAMTQLHFAPAPGGPVSPDTFRAYEAIYAGAVPLLDAYADNGAGEGFWRALLGDNHPFPVIEEWTREAVVEAMESAPKSYEVQAWWGLYVNWLSECLRRDLERLAGITVEQPYMSVVINASPIAHNDEVFYETFESALTTFGDDIPYFIIADGVRPEQEHLRESYEAWLSETAWGITHHMSPNFHLLVSRDHVHQVELMRQVLPHIETEALAFIEHDTPVFGDIPARAIASIVTSGAVDLVRLYPEVEIPEEHGYLMLDETEIGGVPLRRTTQWSQRPHIASTKVYAELLEKEFTPEARTYIEDKMHSVCQRRDSPYRLAIFTPPGSIKRSSHLDGRQGAPKFDDRLVF